MEDIIRIGIVSSMDPKTGMVRVYYQDQENTTTPLHLFCGHGEYAMPKVGEQVVVAHLSNDTSTGIVMGGFWSEAVPPPEGVIYKKQITPETYETIQGGTYTIHAPEIRFEGNRGSITLSELVNLKSKVERLERNGI